ncbi:protein STICHEL-like 2 [Salvia hispanica]|uniref:protein STICHEL-like 2 n=1 Tax=Salvia hispanica TaxID=49212 RepID=UPI002009BF28|nr:protein STICHEL-like 2 [Salvia hispanica]XP_047977120.1 protein STICHEL-like 2 [Salvia hispanica]XP_047977121.1 protein STICHEL-like 2 [Salvia hispanica]XP_047977122.1 protein STICHEL-like 2 [Salvia hispanica]
MDGRRHSIDLPISRTLFALRRVRSLRDPSTNSMSRLSALVDNLNWETKSSGAIVLGFENGCSGDSDDDSNFELKSSRLFMEDEEKRLCEHELDPDWRNQETMCVKEESRMQCKENGGDVLQTDSLGSMGDYVRNKGLCARPKRRLKQADKVCRGKSKCSSWNRKHNRLSRVRAGDALSSDVSSCYSASDASMEGLSGGVPFYASADLGMMGSRMRNCRSGTSKPIEPKPLADLEERPLLLTEERMGCLQNRVGIDSCLETPRSLCQKFMPKSFKELVGQNVVVKSLLSAVSSGRIASLYLFHGPRGTGKTSAARVFAAALNCLSPGIEKPCGLCRDCVLFFSGRSSDVKEVDLVEINKMGSFRSLIKNVDVPPIFSRFKVYIVDDCHLLQRETWVALGDKMEELLPHVVFIAVTPDLDKLPSSIVSKAQRYNFQIVKVADIASRLHLICKEEGVEIDEDALNFVASKSNGSVRDAETMLDQLSLLAKKITMSLVYEVNGVVSDAELLDLLHLALSSDASNTIKKVRELIASRIDPLQLISQLASLITDILAGKCDGEIDRKLFGLQKSGAELEQLRHALKILYETDKQLRTSKNQTMWLTVALLQLSSAGASHDEDAPRLSSKVLHAQEGESHRMSTDECWKHPVTSSCENASQYEVETLELIWIRATRICESSSVKNFLQKRGKLVSVRLIQGVAVADLEFDHPDHVSRAEKSWKVIAGVLQRILGYNVELRINLANSASKLKKPSLNLFSCSRRVYLQSHFCAECGSSASEYSIHTPTAFLTRDRYLQTRSLDREPQILHTCCHGNEVVSSIRNSDGNALSIGIKTPQKSVVDSMDREVPPGSDTFCNGIENLAYIKRESRSRRSESWRCCWRTVIFPFRKAQTILSKKLC